MPDYLICSHDTITETQASGFSIETEHGEIAFFIVKFEGLLHAYKNQCPHIGVPLNWQPDEFLSLEKTHIQCSTHGALFNLGDGHCVAGPCAGDRLQALAIEQRGNELWLLGDSLSSPN